MEKRLPFCTTALVCALAFAHTAAAQAPAATTYAIDSLSGDVTAHEVDTFITVTSSVKPIPFQQWGPNGVHNQLADFKYGPTLQSINYLYEITRELPALARENRQLIDLAMQWSETWLIHRNDLPAGEHRVMWTKDLAPIWPPDAPPSQYAGCETAETTGLIADTALNILRTPAIWNDVVPDGDPNHYGATYLERAKTYKAMLEFTMASFFDKQFLDTSTLTMKHPSSPIYNGPNNVNAGSNNVNAWNRGMMFMHAYQTMGQIEEQSGGNATLAAKYKSVVKRWTQLFVQNAKPIKAPDGTPVFDWGYGNYGDTVGYLTSEQSNIHAQYDIWGLTRAYRAGYTDVTAQQMKTYADTIVHELMLQTTTDGAGIYAPTIDRQGDSSGNTYNYLPAGFMYLVPYNTAIYLPGAKADLDTGRYKNDAGITVSILWAKHWLALHHG
ncbi:hypothetical protein [Dyella silvatica]|uniref:hypothetical protein n=1 Tax=Dyella silvatica TaxID=2992128 RepID=UPI00225971C7|nr:hypothetical protein [Dyella silvatica]